MAFDYKIKIQNKLKKLANFFTIFKKAYKLKFFIYYLIILLFCAWILTTNLTLKTNISTNPLNLNIHGLKKFSFIDALFTAGSAFSDTGLTVISIFDQFNIFGQIIILFLIQLGGIGLTVLKYIFIRAIGKKIGFTDSLAFNDERGYSRLGSSESIIITTIILIFGLQFISSIALMFHFHSYTPDSIQNLNINNGPDFKNFNNLFSKLNHSYFLSFWYGWFHSTSAINNAGFDIFGNNSLIYFSTDYFFQVVMILLLVIGGIGFPVYFEIYQKIKYKLKYQKHYRFSLLFKFSIISYFFISFFGISLVFLFESFSHTNNWIDNSVNNTVYGNQNLKAPPLFSDPDYSWTQKIFFIIFNTQSTRNAGFATLPMQQFSPYTKIIFSLLMWIGASPCSTGGGIRGTTLFIILLALWKKIRGEKQINIFKKRISLSLVSSAFIVFFASCILLLLATLFCNSSLDPESSYGNIMHYTILDSFFTVCSGFGTTGLSTGFTYYLNSFSKIIVIVVMFIGQLTISNTLILTTSRKFTEKKRKINYPKENILIG